MSRTRTVDTAGHASGPSVPNAWLMYSFAPPGRALTRVKYER